MTFFFAFSAVFLGDVGLSGGSLLVVSLASQSFYVVISVTILIECVFDIGEDVLVLGLEVGGLNKLDEEVGGEVGKEVG